ncbi:putative nucleoporin [Xylogone sp. PMI_703]|nr:putative nucleoporin [Xylogone sp. PMI_703]
MPHLITLLTNGNIGGGFGTNTSTGFGAQKTGAFGAPATTGGGLFGSNTATAGTGTGFSGFGTNTNTTSSPFGSTNTGGGLFGANKPAFGSTATTTTSNPFGGAATTGFGGGTTSTFGAPASTALGGNVGEAPGTGSVQFQATVEKEPGGATNQQNAYQNICFQPAYQKWSPEELRLVDYAQGRRYGNSSAFGNTSFGGFGSTTATTPATTGFGSGTTGTGTGLFGSAATSSPFGGQPQQTTNTFGSNTTGSLFGQKPSTGLFGSTTTTQSPFGGTNTSTAFGGTNTNTGSGLFGNNAAANKPPFSFSTTQPAATSGGFGTTGTTTAFGGGSNLFGNNQQPNTASPFGGAQQQQQQPASNPFGGFGANNTQQTQQTGTSLFGGAAQQQKPAGSLFGAAPAAGGGLFGSASQPAAGGGIFGASQPAANTNPFGAASNTQNSSLFGGNKLATPTTGNLFGGGAQNTNTGLFGNLNNQNQTQQNTGSLFGGAANQAQKPALFGAQNPGTGLFGNTGNQQQGTSLFGGQQQQPQNSLLGGNSLFGTSAQPQQQVPQSLTASINDNAAYGTASLFSNLAATQVNNPGPIATPLSSSVKQKKTPVLPMYRLNPASASRSSTPQKRGFGFSYSTYGSPGSTSSTSSTPGNLSGSLFGGSLSKSLGKSLSQSSLRRSLSTEDSILAPGAFSATSGSRNYGSTGSMKKLVINRGIRSDLFTPPTPPQQSPQTGILKKRVSFESSSMQGNVNGSQNGTSSLKQVQNHAEPSSEELGYLRPRASTNGSDSNGTISPPDMEQVKGNELAVIEEDTSSQSKNNLGSSLSREDPEPGQYWMKPTKEEIQGMNRVQRQKVTGFTVGRDGVGQVTFNVPVDLTNINLDEIFDDMVVLLPRSCTVYPNPSKKPPMGKGLNVPSTISLKNSWPRGKDKRTPTGEKSGPRVQKHIERLKRVADTNFVDYDAETGVWTFTVEHFTTYGLDYDEEEDGDGVNELGQSTASILPGTPTPTRRTPRNVQFEESFASSSMSRTESDPDDTFDFKRRKILPGAFDDEYVEEEGMEDEEPEEPSFLDDRSVGSQSDNAVEEPLDQDDVFVDDESVSIVDQDMAGAFPEADNSTEHENDSHDDEIDMDETPGPIMRARMMASKNSGSPTKKKFKAGDDWTSALKTTISPQKQDRAQLKSLLEIQENELRSIAPISPVKSRVVSDGRGFATSIDLMNSLFGQPKSPAKVQKTPAKPQGFEFPYELKSKTGDDLSKMSESERGFHDSLKPSWSYDGTLVYSTSPGTNTFGRSSRRAKERDGLVIIQKGGVVSECRDIRFAKFSNESSANLLKKQKSFTSINDSNGVPLASLSKAVSFSNFFDSNVRDPAAIHERLVWELASVLFDEIAIPAELEHIVNVENRLRKANLSDFWQKLVDHSSTQQVAMARSNEEKAIACLAGRRIPDACSYLANGKDFHLATLVALIGSNDNMRKDMREQLNEWRKSRVLSEFSQPIRAIYEMLASNVCVCEGSKGPAEDRIESFAISKRFGLDWREAFGLRLWYATHTDSDIEAAVKLFGEDLSQDKEAAKPITWYVEQRIPTLWDDPQLEQREDLLWGLLKIYALPSTDLEAVLTPENSQLSPLDYRLSWQLRCVLTSSGIIEAREDTVDKTDQASLAFAAQLSNEGSWLDATFVLLHLSSADARKTAIQNHLAHYAGRIGSGDSQSFITLTQDFKIPQAWVWEAKALYMRSVKQDSKGEVECLIQAGSFDEAHRTFAKKVAPTLIIEQDYATLRILLNGFHGKEDSISEWHLGGEIYQDFLVLLDAQKSGAVDDLVLERLLNGLPAVADEANHPDFLEKVAVQLISEDVAKTVVNNGKRGNKENLPKVLRLPLTEDKYLQHTVELSLEYYRNVMAGVKG